MTRLATTDRNKEITRRVLMGETIVSLAKEYGLSPPRISQIVIKTCRQKNRQWFAAMPKYSLQWLREHKRIFIDEPNAKVGAGGTAS